MVSQLAAQVLGRGPVYLMVQAATMIILSWRPTPAMPAFPCSPPCWQRMATSRASSRASATGSCYSNGILILSGLSMGLPDRLPGRHPRPAAAIRPRGVPVVHAIPARHGPPMGPPPRKPLDSPRGGQPAWGHRSRPSCLAVVGVTRFVEGAWMVVVVIPAAGRGVLHHPAPLRRNCLASSMCTASPAA
ncbi:MAG: hypothetical protein MZV64_70525 [Ignavibacteriales bacterium]|nr:hypothetical protein [Ignavibacteriales bacterium]